MNGSSPPTHAGAAAFPGQGVGLLLRMECCTADLPARVLDTEPARIIDRSFHGVGCIVPGLARLEPGQRVTVTVGDHQRAGTISRVRGFGNQVRVGVRLDEI